MRRIFHTISGPTAAGGAANPVNPGNGTEPASSLPAASSAPAPAVLKPSPKARPSGYGGGHLPRDAEPTKTFDTNAKAWAYLFNSCSVKQRRALKRFRPNNTMFDGMYPEWPAEMTVEEFLVFADP